MNVHTASVECNLHSMTMNAYTSCVLPHRRCGLITLQYLVTCHMTHYINIWVTIMVLKRRTES